VAGLVAVVIAGAALFNVSGVARPSWISGASPVVREDPAPAKAGANPPARGSSPVRRSLGEGGSHSDKPQHTARR
jgi:hypothetical protein